MGMQPNPYEAPQEAGHEQTQGPGGASYYWSVVVPTGDRILRWLFILAVLGPLVHAMLTFALR